VEKFFDLIYKLTKISLPSGLFSIAFPLEHLSVNYVERHTKFTYIFRIDDLMPKVEILSCWQLIIEILPHDLRYHSVIFCYEIFNLFSEAFLKKAMEHVQEDLFYDV